MKTAVVLFNLGGPDNLEAVGPFLFNLFFDPSIIALPTPFRWLIAKLIASRREHTAREIYAKLGGGSPLLPNTQAQADAVGAILGPAFKVFVAMRYWHPRASQTVRAVKDWQPDQIVLQPLYPQYSASTTGSSVLDWQHEAKRQALSVATRMTCCYPRQSGFAEGSRPVCAVVWRRFLRA